jgi:flagellar hook-length control protein FliK
MDCTHDAEVIRFERSLVSGIASETGAVRHAAQLAQGQRNVPPPDSTDQASPFSALLDEANIPPGPAPTIVAAANPKGAARPKDGAARPQEDCPQRPTAAETSPIPQQPAAGSSAPQIQTAPPPGGQKASDVAAAALAALVDRNGGGETDAHADAPPAATPGDQIVTNLPADLNAGSSAAAPANRRDDKSAKSDASDSSASNPDAADTPAIGQQVPTPQPIAVALTLAAIAPAPPAPDPSQNGSDIGDPDSANASAPDPDEIAALGDAIKARGGKADRADAPPNLGSNASETASDRGPKPDAKTVDAARLTPSLTASPPEKTPLPPSGQDQSTPINGSQDDTADAIAARQAPVSHARQLGARPQASDTDAAPGSDSGIAPAADPNAPRDVSAKLPLADITRQALDTLARHSERPEIAPDQPAIGTQAGDTAHASNAAPLAPALLTIPAATSNAPAAGAPAVPIAGIAVEIAAQAQAGRSRFDIRLDPPELGRIDVRLEVDRDGKVTSRLIVERPETLDILRRDASEIERSLQQAGLKTADGNALQFSLRDNDTSGGFGGFGGYNPYPNSGSPAGAARLIIPDRELPPLDGAAAGYGGSASIRGGVDIRV